MTLSRDGTLDVVGAATLGALTVNGNLTLNGGTLQGAGIVNTAQISDKAVTPDKLARQVEFIPDTVSITGSNTATKQYPFATTVLSAYVAIQSYELAYPNGQDYWISLARVRTSATVNGTTVTVACAAVMYDKSNHYSNATVQYLLIVERER
jgi:hypothetical protein